MASKTDSRALQELYQKHGEDTMDVVFATERWQPSPTIIRVVNPEDLKCRRFVLVWNNKGQAHKCCPFYHHMMIKETVAKTDGDNSAMVKVPGLHKGEAEMDKVFVPWEEREAKDCDHDMVQKLFVKRQTAPKKAPEKKKEKKKNKKMKTSMEQSKKKRKKSKKSKKNKGKAKKWLYTCNVDVCERIQRVLMRSPYSYNRLKGAAKKKQAQRTDLPTSSAKQQGREARPIPSETMLPRKKAMKKQREEKNKLKEVGKVIDGLFEEVMIRVARSEDGPSKEKGMPR